MATLFGRFPFLKTLFADSGYQGPQFATKLAMVFPHLKVEIVRRSDRAKGFGRFTQALAFLRLASIRLMLRKLCNPK